MCGMAADVSAALVVLTVIPLALLQVPNLIAVAPPGTLATAGASRSGAELVRAAGLALPAMLIAAPAAALAARRAAGAASLAAIAVLLAARACRGSAATPSSG